MLGFAKIFLLIILPLLLTACSDPHPQDCRNLVFKWGALIKRMENLAASLKSLSNSIKYNVK